MENTLSLFVESLNEHWEMPDSLAIKWNEYESEHPINGGKTNADEIYRAWFDNLSPDEQRSITRRKAEA